MNFDLEEPFFSFSDLYFLTKGLVFKVVDVNEVTKRCYIEIADSNLPLNPQELVGFEMIELA